MYYLLQRMERKLKIPAYEISSSEKDPYVEWLRATELERYIFIGSIAVRFGESSCGHYLLFRLLY